MANDQTSPLSFEDALKRLEEIVRLLEEGEIGLNESLERYEEGVKLLRQSYDLLQRAERRIELLSGVDAEGNPVTEPFDDTATFNAGQVANLPDIENSPAKQRSRRRSSPHKPPDRGTDDPQAGEIGVDGP
jgi:exodeoxyribonuclease VII small subunit